VTVRRLLRSTNNANSEPAVCATGQRELWTGLLGHSSSESGGAEPVDSVVNGQGLSHRREPRVLGTLGISKPTRKQKETLAEHQQEYARVCRCTNLHRGRSVIVG
jgi:hypothetical protein